MALKMISTNSSVGKGMSRANWTPVKMPPWAKSFGLSMPVRIYADCVAAHHRRQNYTKLRTATLEHAVQLHCLHTCCAAALPSHMLLLCLLILHLHFCSRVPLLISGCY